MTLTVVTAASWCQRLWAVPAAFGVAVLGGSLDFRDLPGVAFALVAAGAWAAYRRTSFPSRLARTPPAL
jgi:hypothetical protein